MLDTIALTLAAHEFEILEPERFSPSARGLLVPPYYTLGARANFPCVQNPTKTELRAGRYLPRLTLAKRVVQGGFALTLRVEFSAPKLLLGNNFDELRSRDFEQVVTVLVRLLLEMGVRVQEGVIRGAGVSAIHYSKNIALTDFTSCTMVIAELGRIDLSQRLDLAQTDYRNSGHAIRYHSNSLDLIFYDKIKDLQRSRTSGKRALERDNLVQIDLLAEPKKFVKPLEVLRMEVRLGNRTKIKDVLKRAGVDAQPTFAGLFDSSIAEEILMYFWGFVRGGLPVLGHGRDKPEKILEELLKGASRCRPAKLIQIVGSAALVQSIGPRGLRALLGSHCCNRTWQRISREIRGLPGGREHGFRPLLSVDEALKAFIPLRLKDFTIPHA